MVLYIALHEDAYASIRNHKKKIKIKKSKKLIPAPKGHPRGAEAGGTANALHIHLWAGT